MTDWTTLLACTVCEAKMGEACYTLLGAGPQALPSQRADVPHSSRKVRGQARKPATATARTTATPVPQRRTDRTTERQVAAWLKVGRRT